MRVQSKRVIVLLFANGLLACPAIAWGPLAHYQSVVSYRPAQNLPDLWISRQPIPFGYSAIGVEVAEYFAWSHGCRRSGVVSAAPDWLLELAAWQIAFIDVVYPAEPTPHGVPQGVEEPEEDMKEIINSKLLISNYSANELALMKKTARGFAGHNAADSVVHFTYFKGDSIDGWIAEHKIKESWAELAVFENILGEHNGDSHLFRPCPVSFMPQPWHIRGRPIHLGLSTSIRPAPGRASHLQQQHHTSFQSQYAAGRRECQVGRLKSEDRSDRLKAQLRTEDMP
jgi:hypothetical protein